MDTGIGIFKNYLPDDAKKELDEYLKKQLESKGLNFTGSSTAGPNLNMYNEPRDIIKILSPRYSLESSTANPFYSGIIERRTNDAGKETGQTTGSATTETTGQETVTGDTPSVTDGTNGTQSGLDGYLQAYERYSQLARDNTQRQLDYGLARIEKYLPNYLKSQGLSGQGVAETTYINALNNYNTAAREAEADQLASAMEMAKYKSEVEREQARYDYEDKKATENEKYVRGLEEYQRMLDYITGFVTEDTTESDVDKLLEDTVDMTDSQKNLIKKYALAMMPDGWADEEGGKTNKVETVGLEAYETESGGRIKEVGAVEVQENIGKDMVVVNLDDGNSYLFQKGYQIPEDEQSAFINDYVAKNKKNPEENMMYYYNGKPIIVFKGKYYRPNNYDLGDAITDNFSNIWNVGIAPIIQNRQADLKQTGTNKNQSLSDLNRYIYDK